VDIIDYVVSLSKKHYEEIGFLPKPRLEQYNQAGQLWSELENGELCGFMVWGAGWPVLRVYQVCIQYDAQRREHGINLVMRLITKADTEGYEAISCYVADDIEANKFWKQSGFTCIGQREGGARRGRKHNHWVMFMKSPMQQILIAA
jgi:L-amino acid N-acyltransferase YncA